MRSFLDKQLKEINEELIEMGSLIQEAIGMAITGLVTQDKEKLKDVISFDTEINHKEKTIEDLCLKVLLQQQPVAKDLRVVSAALKMITDMERIGDHASDIGEVALELIGQDPLKKLDDMQAMSKEAMVMVMQSLEAFSKKDLELAKSVIKHDDIIDDYFFKIKKELIELINKNVKNGEKAADLLMIAKYFERIGDHATNIAEWVIFSITGKHKEENK